MVDLAPPPSEGSEVSGVASGVTSSSGAGAASVIAYQRSQIADLRRRLDAATSEKSALESTVRDLREKNAGLARKLSQCSRRCRAFGRTRRSGSWGSGSVCSSSSDGAGSCSDSSDDEGSPPPRPRGAAAAGGHHAATMDALGWSARVKDAQVRELTAQVQASYEFIAILRDQNSEIMREKNAAEKKLADAERAMSDRTPIHANGLIGRRRAPMSAKDDGNDGTGTEATSASALTSSLVTDGEEEVAVQRTRAERAERERDALRSLLREMKEREEKRNRRSSKSRSPSPKPTEEEEEEGSEKESGSVSAQQQRRQVEKKKASAEADRRLISELKQKLSGTEEELRNSKQEVASLKEQASIAAPSQNFDLYYEPAVKNLKFLLEMRERAVKDARTERDEALREAELLRKQNEQFRYSTRRGAAPPSSPTAEALPPAVHANLVHSAVA